MKLAPIEFVPDQRMCAEGKPLPYSSTPTTCPVRTLAAWLEVAEVTEGPIFRPVNRHDQVQHGRLTDQSVALVVKRAGERGGVSEVAAPGAMFLLYGFRRPPRLAPMQAGLTAEEVRQRFAENRWELVSAEPVRADEIRAVGRRVDETFEVWRYRLRRR